MPFCRVWMKYAFCDWICGADVAKVTVVHRCFSGNIDVFMKGCLVKWSGRGRSCRGRSRDG